jgi:hypothetical protein
MIELLKKQVDLDGSPVLFEEICTPGNLERNWLVKGGADWRAQDDAFLGVNSGNHPGMIISRADFFGDVFLDFEARTVPPSTHDIDWMWNGSWDDATDTRGTAYVAGLQGWWTGKVGFERSPDYRLNVATPLFPFEPGRWYHIQSGSIAGHIFVVVDERLVLEVTDPDPIDAGAHGRVGFEAYASMIQVRSIKVRRPSWQAIEKSYPAEW